MKLRQLKALTLLAMAFAWRGVCQPSRINARQAKLGGLAAKRPVSCVMGQVWLATDTGVLSYCSASGTPGTWNALTSAASGGGTADSLCEVALSATPVFDAGQCNAFHLMLGSTAVASSSLVNAQPGQKLTFLIGQDATGGRSFVWPVNVGNGCGISRVPGVVSIVTAIYDGATANTTQCTTSDDGTLLSGPTRNAPGTPAEGLTCWFDTLAGGGTWKCKDTGGNVRAAVLTSTGATPNEVMKYIDADGVAHTGAVTETELSLSDVTAGNASTSQHGFLPKLPGDNTKCLLGDGTYGTCTTGGGGGYTQNGAGIYSLFDGIPAPVPYTTSYQIMPNDSAGGMRCSELTLSMAVRLQNYFTIPGGGGGANDVFAFALYTDNGSHAPGTKISGSDFAVAGNENSYVPHKGAWGTAHPVLPAGVYWGCHSHSATTGNWKASQLWYGPFAAEQFSSPLSPRTVTCSNTVTYNGTSTTMPNNCSSPAGVFIGSQTQAPMVWVVQ